jgi:hypothetical protein
MWYNDFKTYAHKSKSGGGKGGGGSSTTTSYTYSVACLLGLCEGPIGSIGTIWKTQTETTSLSALNLTLYQGTHTQTPFGYITTNHPDQALNYLDLAYLASSKYDLGDSATIPQHSFQVYGLLSNSQYALLGIHDVNMADVLQDFLTNTRYGPGLDAGLIGDLTNYYAACQTQGFFMSPVLDTQEQLAQIIDRWAQVTYAWIFWDGQQIQARPLLEFAAVGNGSTYTPNNTAVYDLTNDDFVVKEGDPPVQVDIGDPADAYNTVRININDRNKRYENNAIEWRDQDAVSRYGVVLAPDIQAKEITDPNTAATVLSLVGNRLLYIRTKYSFTLGPEYVLLMIGDILTVTEVGLGLVRVPVIISDLEEDEKDNIKVTAWEYPQGTPGAGAQTGVAPVPNTAPNVGLPAGNVNAPAIFEPFPSLTGGDPQIWVGASSTSQGWGGADVYVSTDNISYQWMGQITQPATQGVLTATLPDASGTDTTNTLAIDLTMSQTTMSPGATHADADADQTLCLVGSEILDYGNLTVTGTNLYSLTYLPRGRFGSAHSSHAAGTGFCRLDESILKISLPAAYVGVPLYLKFVSFNSFGQGQQNIASVPYYTYTPNGNGYYIAPPGSPTITPTRTLQGDGTNIITLTFAWTASAGPLLASYDLQWSTDGGTTWTGATAGASSTQYQFKPAVPSTNYLFRVRARSQNNLAVSAWVTSASTSSGTLNASVPATPTGFAVTAGPDSAIATWSANASTDAVLQYNLYRATGPSGSFASATLQWSGSTLGYTQSGLADNSNWTYFLTAANSAGESGHTAGIDITALPQVPGGQPYDVVFGYNGPPSSGLTILRFVADRSLTMPSALAGSKAVSSAAVTTGAVITLYKNGSSIGTINWAASATSATFTFASAVTLASGDVLTGVVTTADPTFTNPSATLALTRN